MGWHEGGMDPLLYVQYKVNEAPWKERLSYLSKTAVLPWDARQW